MNTLFCCSFLINYFKDSSKFLFELFIVVKYQFLVFILFLDCLIKKLMQLEINPIKDCILEQEHDVKFLVHLEFELFVIEFNIQLKLSQENLQLFSLVSKDVEYQYLRCVHLMHTLKIDLTCQSCFLCRDNHSYIVRAFKVLCFNLRFLEYRI